ncbi:DUF4229 domain-containing protein [Streptomyces calidiresistens]|uniref:DUF4229 domain-containing protein n=1 Tax=Streptomyces calidiresistens TaxID=1485586 RepID=UPI002B20D6A3|nr:DUF4229 domain-containing protein [Streptomyces calidiresistens]
MTRSQYATLRYTALRLGVFAACLIVVTGLSWVGLIPAGIGESQPFWLVALAILISAPISYVVLRRQREAMSEQVIDGVGRAKQRLRANQTMEDGPEDRPRDGAATRG